MRQNPDTALFGTKIANRNENPGAPLGGPLPWLIASAPSQVRSPAKRYSHLSRVVRRDNEVANVETRSNGTNHWAVIIPHKDSVALSPDFVASATGVARQMFGRGIRVVSPALTEEEIPAFVNVGYKVQRELTLLVAELAPKRWWNSSPEPFGKRSFGTGSGSAVHLTNFRQSELSELLGVDLRAFGRGSEMDEGEFRSAQVATPVARLKIARQQGTIAGFALLGRAGRRGYLQRLAVDPRFQGKGVGRRLVTDALSWSQGRGVTRVVVNTETTNQKALALYKSVGFSQTATSLYVLQHEIASSTISAAATTTLTPPTTKS